MENFHPKSPFYGFCMASHEPLRRLKERYSCASCGKSVRYFCYYCHTLAPGVHQDNIPIVSLPLKLTIIKHAKETEGKSTATHAKLLAPDQVELIAYDPKNPNSLESISVVDGREAVLLYPSADANYVEDMDWRNIKRLVVIDGTWPQAQAMANSLAFKQFNLRVKLRQGYSTLFWRYQNIGPHCLSTIEAIYRFFQELLRFEPACQDQRQQLDNLLYFFAFQYGLIQNDYVLGSSDRQFTSKHKVDYINRSTNTVIN